MSLARSAVVSFVRRSDDVRLERVFGSSRGMRFLFRRMERAYVPAEAAGTAGDIVFALPGPADADRVWVVHVDASAAHAHPGQPGLDVDALLTVKVGVPDLVRIAVGQEDAGRALLDGRLDLIGDSAVAERLGPMFGRPRTF